MNYDDVNFNEIIISGIINKIIDNNSDYIKLIIISQKFINNENKSVYVGLNISRNLYNTYLDYFYLGNKIFVKGYLNSYIDKNNIAKNFVTVIDVYKNPKEMNSSIRGIHIRYDEDGMLVWNGKRCESEIATPEEQEEMRRMIAEIL